MDTLEARFTWWDPCGRSIIERLYRYAEGMLRSKELEYLDAPQPGTLKERIARLKFHILEEMEDRRLGRRSDEPVPFRVKELRRACLKALAVPGISREERQTLRRDLNSLFVAIQLFSYPGDYVRENPTLERLAEIMTKFEQDALGVTNPAPRGPRRAVVKMGEPIDVRSYLGPGGRRSRAPPRPLPRRWSCKSRASWTRSDPAGRCPSRHSCPLRPECRFPNRPHEPVLLRGLADRENAIRIAVDAIPVTGYDLVSVQLCIMAVRLKASTVDSP